MEVTGRVKIRLYIRSNVWRNEMDRRGGEEREKAPGVSTSGVYKVTVKVARARFQNSVIISNI